jgi:hypothetical protein
VSTNVTGEATPYGGRTIEINRTIDQTILMHVFSVNKKGVAAIDPFHRELLLDSAGRMDSNHRPYYRRMRVTPNGRVIRDSGLGIIPGPGPDVWLPVAGQLFSLLPSSPVGPEDEWTDQINEPFRFGDGHLMTEVHGYFFGFTGGGEPEIKMSYRLPLDVTVYLPQVMQLDGHPEQAQQYPDARVRYAGFAADVTSETWLDPRGRPWPVVVDVSGGYTGDVWFHDFPTQQEPQQVQVRLLFSIVLSRLD